MSRRDSSRRSMTLVTTCDPVCLLTLCAWGCTLSISYDVMACRSATVMWFLGSRTVISKDLWRDPSIFGWFLQSLLGAREPEGNKVGSKAAFKGPGRHSRIAGIQTATLWVHSWHARNRCSPPHSSNQQKFGNSAAISYSCGCLCCWTHSFIGTYIPFWATAHYDLHSNAQHLANCWFKQ